MTRRDRSDIFCSLTDATSWIDPVTNLTLLSSVWLEKHLGQLTQLKYPLTCFPSFTHEVTHHWCLDTPTGSALALLMLRARSRAASIHSSSSVQSLDVVEDLIRYETAVAFLRPLAEGLALFAEFDATPLASTIVSTPMTWAWRCFSNPQDEELKSGHPSSLLNLLYNERLFGGEFVRRKADLLVQPMSCTNGGYLPGYLAVRQLWILLAGRCNRLWDADLFMAYLTGIFFEDLGFVGTLLDPQTRGKDSVIAIATHLQHRFETLLHQADLTSAVEAFERDTSQATSRPRFEPLKGGGALVRKLRTGETLDRPGSFQIPGLFADSELSKLGQERLFGLVSDLLGPQGREVDRWTLAQRDLMCLGSLQASVQISRGKMRVEHKGRTIIQGPALPGVKNVSAEGSLEFFISLYATYQAIAVSIGQDVVFAHFLGEVDENTRAQFRSYTTNRDSLEAQVENERHITDAIIEEGPARVVLQQARTFNAAWAQQVYDEASSRFSPDIHWKDCLRRMRVDGFWPILEEDPALVRALAVLGLSRSFLLTRAEVSEVFSTLGIDLDSTLTSLSRCANECGFPFFLEADGQLACLI